MVYFILLFYCNYFVHLHPIRVGITHGQDQIKVRDGSIAAVSFLEVCHLTIDWMRSNPNNMKMSEPHHTSPYFPGFIYNRTDSLFPENSHTD